jgi:signal transduction histidine kinase
VKRLSFRTRVLLYLVLFAVVPSSVLMLGGAGVVSSVLPVLASGSAWDSVAASGRQAIAVARSKPLTDGERQSVDELERELESSVTNARQVRYLSARAAVLVAVLALIGSVLVAVLASRVAGHLSRQLSRPLSELVGWTELIGRGRSLPEQPPRRGAPEFEVLRRRMRKMAAELAVGRTRELEAERLRAFRETARRVAHELKNPLTPIRFAVERLKRDAPPPLTEVVEVLATETERLEKMARSFSQFGKLPEGPAADVDLGELVRYVVRATVPETVSCTLEVEPDLPMVRGHHDAIARAVTNILLNAVDACRDGGTVTLRVTRGEQDGSEAVRISVHDSGCGIPPEQLAHIWEPYVTTKAAGTGLGLAIARQTVLAHDGAVAATSTPEKGTMIVLSFPIVSEAAPVPSASGREEQIAREKFSGV